MRYGLINSLFDQIVTFRLAELKEAWSSIYEAEKAIEEAKKRKKDVTNAVALVREARALATKVTVSEARANDKEFNKAFKGKQKSQARSKLETEWGAMAKVNYLKARELATKVVEML